MKNVTSAHLYNKNEKYNTIRINKYMVIDQVKKQKLCKNQKFTEWNNELLTKLEEATINEGIFMEIGIRVGADEIVATGSERGNRELP